MITSSKLNPNLCSARRLAELTSLSEDMANAIVEYRRKHRRINHIDELWRIRGMSDQIFKDLQSTFVIPGQRPLLSNGRDSNKLKDKYRNNYVIRDLPILPWQKKSSLVHTSDGQKTRKHLKCDCCSFNNFDKRSLAVTTVLDKSPSLGIFHRLSAAGIPHPHSSGNPSVKKNPQEMIIENIDTPRSANNSSKYRVYPGLPTSLNTREQIAHNSSTKPEQLKKRHYGETSSFTTSTFGNVHIDTVVSAAEPRTDPTSRSKELKDYRNDTVTVIQRRPRFTTSPPTSPNTLKQVRRKFGSKSAKTMLSFKLSVDLSSKQRDFVNKNRNGSNRKQFSFTRPRQSVGKTKFMKKVIPKRITKSVSAGGFNVETRQMRSTKPEGRFMVTMIDTLQAISDDHTLCPNNTSSFTAENILKYLEETSQPTKTNKISAVWRWLDGVEDGYIEASQDIAKSAKPYQVRSTNQGAQQKQTRNANQTNQNSGLIDDADKSGLIARKGDPCENTKADDTDRQSLAQEHAQFCNAIVVDKDSYKHY